MWIILNSIIMALFVVISMINSFLLLLTSLTIKELLEAHKTINLITIKSIMLAILSYCFTLLSFIYGSLILSLLPIICYAMIICASSQLKEE